MKQTKPRKGKLKKQENMKATELHNSRKKIDLMGVYFHAIFTILLTLIFALVVYETFIGFMRI